MTVDKECDYSLPRNNRFLVAHILVESETVSICNLIVGQISSQNSVSTNRGVEADGVVVHDFDSKIADFFLDEQRRNIIDGDGGSVVVFTGGFDDECRTGAACWFSTNITSLQFKRVLGNTCIT